MTVKNVFSAVVAMGLVAMGLLACVKSQPPSSARQEPDTEKAVSSAGLDVQRFEVKNTIATVEAVDLKARKLTLRNVEGRVFVIHLGEEAVNLPQVRKGDVVELTFGHELEVRMAEPGEFRNEQSVFVGGAQPGARPRGVGITQTNITARILALDRTDQLVKLEFADGPIAVVKVQNPANLDKVAVGDNLAISSIEVVEVKVKKGGKR